MTKDETDAGGVLVRINDKRGKSEEILDILHRCRRLLAEQEKELVLRAMAIFGVFLAQEKTWMK